MNKQDFYKQLMSEYSFDAEKIKSNAKKGRYAKQKISPLTLGITAAVAVCTVACGTLAMTSVNSKNGIDLIGENQSLSALSSSERVKNAIEQQNKVRNSEELIDVMVTFNYPLSPDTARSVIASHTDANVPVKTVYLADGSRISGSEQVAAVFRGESKIAGVCIECKGSVMTLLQNDADIFLVELVTEDDFDVIAPIAPEDVETIDVDLPGFIHNETTDPTPDDNGGSSAVDPDTKEPEDIIDVPTEENTDSAESSESAETVDVPETNEDIGSASDETGDADVTEETGESTEPVVPVDLPELPNGVTLPINPERFVYETQYLGAESAYFISSNTIFVKTADGFALYDYFNGKESLVESISCSGVKVHWIAENGGRMIVSGKNEDGTRNKMWLVNAHAQAIYDLQAEDTVMDGTLVDAGYHAESGIVSLVVKEYDIYYTFILKLNSDNELDYIGYVFETEADTKLLGYSKSTVYLAVTDGSLSQVYAVDITTNESRILKTYTGNPKFTKNLAFTHGVITPSDSAKTGSIEIFDPSTESFISTGSLDSSVTFGASKHNLSIDGAFYTVSGGQLVPAGGLNAIAAVDYKKSMSSQYAAVADNGYIRITKSVYSDINRSSVLDFGHITSSNDTDFRDVVVGAIGLNNALALNKCAESGMDRLDELNQALPVYYSENAVAQLRKLCEIPQFGALSYTSGGLRSLRADSIEIVISSVGENTASGTLFIKAGSFGGKTAYRAVNISFVRENGVWKLDCIIGK